MVFCIPRIADEKRGVPEHASFKKTGSLMTSIKRP
jgi:hypothetical protein